MRRHPPIDARIGPTAGDPGSDATRITVRRWRRTATVTGSLMILWMSGPAVTGAARVEALPVSESTDTEASTQGPGQESAVERPRDVIAWFEDVAIANLSQDAILVGFHEAAGPGPLTLTPERVVEDHNPGADKPQPAGTAGAEQDTDLVVLPSRGRGAGATTAIDVAVPEGSPILSPVSGTVLTADRYVLYGQHEDHIVRIAPDGRPDLAVKLIHITAPTVQVGQRVEAGRTPIAGSAKTFPFSSQIDRLTEERDGHIGPHVHLELERAG